MSENKGPFQNLPTAATQRYQNLVIPLFDVGEHRSTAMCMGRDYCNPCKGKCDIEYTRLNVISDCAMV